jgi:putative oxidoreductase
MSPSFFTRLGPRLDGVGRALSPLGLRVLLAWEFYEAGIEKLHGQNWFADIAQRFPFPFSRLSPDLNWTMATWLELGCSLALLLGLGTRAVAYVLWVLTVVAIAAVHWPEHWSSLAELWRGYAISDQGYGNYKLPLIYLAMLLPLMLGGAGSLSLDRWLRRAAPEAARGDLLSWGAAVLALCLPLTALLPLPATLGALLGLASIAVHFARSRRPVPAPAPAPA